MLRYLTPLAIFLVLVYFLYAGLSLDPRKLDSTFIGKEAPLFILPKLSDMQQKISNKDMLGKVWLMNVWASWCVSCRQEHSLLMELTKHPAINLYGLNYKDTEADAHGWLKRQNLWLRQDFDGKT